MSGHFRTVDISDFVLPGEAEGRFSHADVAAIPGIPFVTVHLKGERSWRDSLRMDLDKRVFLGDVPDEELRKVAPLVAQHVGRAARQALQMAEA